MRKPSQTKAKEIVVVSLYCPCHVFLSLTHTHTHSLAHTHMCTVVIADVVSKMLPCLFFNRALMKCRDMTACDKVPLSFTPICILAAHNTVIKHKHSETRRERETQTHTQHERATAARSHIDVLSPVDGDEEAIFAHISPPAVCMDADCA